MIVKIDCNAYGKELLEYKTVLDGLSDNKILIVEREKDGMFRVAEGCDNYFSARLTAKQLAALGRELIELSNVTVQGTRHLVEGTLEPIVGKILCSDIMLL